MLQRPAPRLVLASGSASRRALLEAAGLRFEVRPAPVDEAAAKQAVRARGGSAADAALYLAGLKAGYVARLEPDALVIGADQILVCDGVWYDKPVSVAAAREQLQALRGRSHELLTAVVCAEGERQVWQHVAAPSLAMRNFSNEFLDSYLVAEGDEVTTTVGSYRVEGRGVHLFDSMNGAHSAILGLPMLPLLAFLRDRSILTR